MSANNRSGHIEKALYRPRNGLAKPVNIVYCFFYPASSVSGYLPHLFLLHQVPRIIHPRRTLMSSDWQTSLFGCFGGYRGDFSSFELCLKASFCP